MQKRGTITGFIALGIIIITILLLLIIAKPDTSIPSPQSNQYGPVIHLIDSCIKQIADESLYDAALGGGYYDVPIPSYEHWYGAVPYYYDRGLNLIPSKKTQESELGKYISHKLNQCVSFDDIEKLGFFIQDKNIIPTPTIQISDESVLFEVSYPLVLVSGGVTKTLDDFRFTRYSNYNDFAKLANSFTQMQSDNPESICMSCLSREAHEKNLTIIISAVDSENLLVEIIEDYDEPLVWVFAHRYEGGKE